jgi:hypothetical protein
MGRWRLLKHALLGTEPQSTVQQHSIHRHEGFAGMVKKQTSKWLVREYLEVIADSCSSTTVEGEDLTQKVCIQADELARRYCHIPVELIIFGVGDASIQFCLAVKDCTPLKDAGFEFRDVHHSTVKHVSLGRARRVDVVLYHPGSRTRAMRPQLVSTPRNKFLDVQPEFDRLDYIIPSGGEAKSSAVADGPVVTVRVRRQGRVSIGLVHFTGIKPFVYLLAPYLSLINRSML